MNLPYLVVSDGSGNIFEIPGLYMAGRQLRTPVLPEENELIPLPYGSDLYKLPGRIAVGYNPDQKQFVEVKEYQGNRVYPLAAFMAPAYIQLYGSAFTGEFTVARLPLYNYTAVGWFNDDFYVAGKRIDPDLRQDLSHFNLAFIDKEAARILKRFPKNRLVRHLVENCAGRYGCPAARNFVLGRWECPLPVSPGCNAACVGCISEQPAEAGIVSPQERLTFTPTIQEIVEFAVPHLKHAPRAVISFGQGCEGEPLLAGEIIEASIREIRKYTSQGVINLNTNASRPDMIEHLCKAGLDSIRVSLNSAQKNYYQAYFRPRNYSFEDVIESLKVACQFNCWVSINYFIFPGFTDHPSEMDALERLIAKVPINMIQTRNLNMDPDWYIDMLNLTEFSGKSPGITGWIKYFQTKYPQIKLGYFNPPREEMLIF